VHKWEDNIETSLKQGRYDDVDRSHLALDWVPAAGWSERGMTFGVS
jgi:hypothetical protein